MTSKDVQLELQKQPLVPFRLHLVSGKTVEVADTGAAWLLQNGVQRPAKGRRKKAF